MAKKTDKALKSLKKDVARLKKQNDKLTETLERTREDQAGALREIRDLLEEHMTTHDTDTDESAAEDDSPDGKEEPEVTEAAERKARDLGVDLTSVKGTGSGGRILVKDVEAAVDAKQ